MVTPSVKREAVAHLKARLGLSERRACRISGADRKMIRYQAQRAPDTVLRGRLRDLANERRRFGYRRLFLWPPREAVAIPHAHPDLPEGHPHLREHGGSDHRHAMVIDDLHRGWPRPAEGSG